MAANAATRPAEGLLVVAEQLELLFEAPSAAPVCYKLSNNSCEQAIRPFVIGRKNWLFSGSPRGAAASALLYSLIETAKANGREPYWYLRELFEKLPLARTRADYLALLPATRPSPPPP